MSVALGDGRGALANFDEIATLVAGARAAAALLIACSALQFLRCASCPRLVAPPACSHLTSCRVPLPSLSHTHTPISLAHPRREARGALS